MAILVCAVGVIPAIGSESVTEPLVGKRSGLRVLWELNWAQLGKPAPLRRGCGVLVS